MNIESSNNFKKRIKISLFITFLPAFLSLESNTTFGITESSGNVVTHEPAGLFLTWQQDPLTTMTIDWHTKPGDNAEPVLRYKKIDHDNWQEIEAASHGFRNSDRTIHRVELTGLEPGTEYQFRVGEFGKLYKFRTMPADINEPLLFATGGDTHAGMSSMGVMNKVIMEKYDLDFILWGGDLAYANGSKDRFDRWHEWFDTILKTLVTEEGRIIPIVVALGNHEMRRAPEGNSEVGGNYYYLFKEKHTYEQTDEWRATYAPYFYNLFAFPGQPGYGALKFGDYLSLLALDSSHSNPVFGEQLEWLSKVIPDLSASAHIIPVYHVPAWPSVRSGGQPASDIKEHWIPLFEEHGVRLVFENHDHAYKRTHPILKEQINTDGIVYIGDGAWGATARNVRSPDERWYLKKSEKVNHAIIVTLNNEDANIVTISNEGKIIDEVTIEN